jgi:hypothetical protein
MRLGSDFSLIWYLLERSRIHADANGSKMASKIFLKDTMSGACVPDAIQMMQDYS